MNVFDIIGPIMVGPSSSHTAGAVRIGYIAGKLMNGKTKTADIYLHGSFLATGKGHGTDKALIAGLLGMHPDDERIPHSFEIAKECNLEFHFHSINLRDAHPNSVQMKLVGMKGRELLLTAASIGGGRVVFSNIDGLAANFSGDYPTVIIHNEDSPGCVTDVSSILGSYNINIAGMQLYRDKRGGTAIMVIECDDEVSPEAINLIKKQSSILKVTYLTGVM